jgi:hypothetical protein
MEPPVNSNAKMELGLRPGEWVEVRSEEEILATLDAGGAIEGLLFMPEMRQYCGRRFQVQSRADKTCDTVTKTGGRRMRHTVHLSTRCDGSGHAECEASCLVFWKEAWLRRVDGPGAAVPAMPAPSEELGRRMAAVACRTVPGPNPVVRYRCQATDLVKASSPLAWWDPRQYWRDWWCGNVTLGRMARVFAIATFNLLQRLRGGVMYPRFPTVEPQTRTPAEQLDLRPGELVQIRSPREIAGTLDAKGRNRGMRFDVPEQTPFCGGTYRVLRRVQRLIDERTGELIELSNSCILLDGVVCSGNYSPKRYFCPRAIYPWWREIWLRRVETPAAAGAPRTQA